MSAMEGDFKKEVEVIGLYLRCSTSKQDIKSQRYALGKYCQEKLYPDHELQFYVDEAQSGAKQNRPAFSKMMKDAEAGKIDKVVVFELSRLSRDMLALLNIMDKLNRLEIPVETPKDGPVPFDGSLQQFLTAAKALVAAEEREAIRTRTRNGLARAKADGKVLGAKPGNQNRKGKKKDYLSLEPDLVKRILVLKGHRLSTHAIADAAGTSQSKVSRILRRLTNDSG